MLASSNKKGLKWGTEIDYRTTQNNSGGNGFFNEKGKYWLPDSLSTSFCERKYYSSNFVDSKIVTLDRIYCCK